MKMTFRGWGREVKPHTHSVTPVQSKNNKWIPQSSGDPLEWDGPLTAHGKVSNLGLSGSFLLELNFDEQEIQNWLTEYVKAHPENALRMLARAQAEATIALSTWQRATPSP